MERVGEVDDRLAAGALTGQLERRLHRVRAGRAGEHQLVVQVARGEHQLLESLQEIALGGGLLIQRVSDAITLDVVDKRGLQRVIVVPVVEGTRTGEEIQVIPAVLAEQVRAFGAVEGGRPGTAVAANFRFELFEHIHV